MASVKYKLADTNDFDAIVSVGVDLFDYDVKKNRAREFLKDERHHMILAYLNNNIIGMASAFHYVHPDKNPSLFITEVGVLEKYQNQKIGRNLVKRLVTYGREIGCEEIWLATEASNVAARRAYIAAGGLEDPESIVLLNFEKN